MLHCLILIRNTSETSFSTGENSMTASVIMSMKSFWFPHRLNMQDIWRWDSIPQDKLVMCTGTMRTEVFPWWPAGIIPCSSKVPMPERPGQMWSVLKSVARMGLMRLRTGFRMTWYKLSGNLLILPGMRSCILPYGSIVILPWMPGETRTLHVLLSLQAPAWILVISSLRLSHSPFLIFIQLTMIMKTGRPYILVL